MILQKNLLWDNSTQPNFQQWAQGISTAMSSMGLTQTRDTGQVDWSTNPAVPGGDLIPYYEIWAFSDGLQSACPVYIRLDYGSNIYTAPHMKFTVGTTTDRAGNLGGNLFGPYIYDPGQNGTGGTAWECDFSSGDGGSPPTSGGRMEMILWRTQTTPTSAPMFFAVERSVDVNGDYTGDYITCLISIQASGESTNTNDQATLMAPGTGAVSLQSGNYVTPTVSATSTGFGNSSSFLPIFPLIGQIGNPLTMAGILKTGDQGEGGVFTISLYGGTITYFYSQAAPFIGVGVSNNNGIAIRWE